MSAGLRKSLFLHCHLKEHISRILLQPLHHQTPCMGYVYVLPTRRNPLSFWRSAEVNRATKRHTWQVSLPMDGRGNKPSSQTGLHQVNLKNQLLTLSWSLSRIISLSKCAPKNGWKSFGAKTKKAPKSYDNARANKKKRLSKRVCAFTVACVRYAHDHLPSHHIRPSNRALP